MNEDALRLQDQVFNENLKRVGGHLCCYFVAENRSKTIPGQVGTNINTVPTSDAAILMYSTSPGYKRYVLHLSIYGEILCFYTLLLFNVTDE